MPDKTTLQDAFKIACVRNADLYMTVLSGRADKSAAFHVFAGAFLNLYLLAINHAKLREFRTADDENLADLIQGWFDTAKSHKDATRGRELFKEFNVALGQVGLL
jgi:hypothetical protein